MKRVYSLGLLLIVALAALACRAAGRALERPEGTTGDAFRETERSLLATGIPVWTEVSTLANGAVITTVTATTGAGEVAAPTSGQKDLGDGEVTLPPPDATSQAPAPTRAGKPPQSQRAEIRPEELRAELTQVKALTGFQVLDSGGALIGTVADFVINTCETYIIYFLVSPVAELSKTAGSLLVIPYEVVTVNSGALDAEADAIQLSLSAAQFAEAPAFPDAQELVPTDWEAGVRDFWTKAVRLSNLTTGCRVSAPDGGSTEIHKVAYASELIGAELHDGLQNRLGQVEEIILEPESGKLSFFVTRLQAGQGLVLVPLRVVNIPKEALGPGTEISLVLLTKNDLLLNAPQISTIEEAVQVKAQASARAYWWRK